MKFVIATGNSHKKEEISFFLGDKIKVSTMKEEGIHIEIVEDGLTFEENALIKARTLRQYVNEVIIADDSGLVVDVLGGQPGVYSARYAGENALDEDNNRKLLAELEKYSFVNRKAKFVCVIALIMPDGQEYVLRGECNGEIGFEYRGANGFGYDPLFIVEGTDKTFAEMSTQEKNEISHRAMALKKLQELLVSKC